MFEEPADWSPKVLEKVDFRNIRPYMYMPSPRLTTINQNVGPIIVLEGMEDEYKVFKKLKSETVNSDNLREDML